MSRNEINNLDPEDIGLQQVMGNRFHDMTKKPMVEPFRTATTNTTQAKKVARKPISKPEEAQWEPTKEHTWMDDLVACAKTSLLFGGLNLLIWYWQISGLMDESIALPSMLICAALAGIGLGKCMKRGNR